MAIKIGVNDAKKIYVGTSEIASARVGTTKVRPSGWKPGANTIAYYPLTAADTTNDKSGNGYNLSNLGGTTFGTYGGISCAAFYESTSSGLYNNSIAIPTGTSPTTFSYYAYPTKYSNSEESSIAIGTASSYQQIVVHRLNPICLGNRGSEITGSSNAALNAWNHIVVTKSGSTGKIYLNGTLIASGSLTFNTQGTRINIGYSYGNNSASMRFIGYLSEVILENKVRTAQEISNYYNSTKSNYGL